MDVGHEMETDLFFSKSRKILTNETIIHSSVHEESGCKEFEDCFRQCCKESSDLHSNSAKTPQMSTLGVSKGLSIQDQHNDAMYPVPPTEFGQQNASCIFLWKFLQKKLCYNFRPFDEMTEDLSKSYAQLVNVFELNWNILEPLTVNTSALHTVISKSATSQSLISQDPQCMGKNLCHCTFPSTQLSSPKETFYVLKSHVMSCSCKSSEKPFTVENHSSAQYHSNHCSPISMTSFYDESDKRSLNRSVYRHYILFPFAIKSQHCVVELPDHWLGNNNIDHGEGKVERFENVDWSLKKSSATLNRNSLTTFECEIRSPRTDSTNTPLPMNLYNLNHSRESCYNTDELNKVIQASNDRCGALWNASFLSRYISDQIAQLGLSVCQYPTNLLVIFLRIPHLVRHYMMQSVYKRDTLSEIQILSLLKKKPIEAYDCDETKNDNDKVECSVKGSHTKVFDNDGVWYPQEFSRILKWNQSKCPLWVRSRFLLPRDSKEKICLFVFFSGKDMIAFDWLPFLGRFYSFAVNHKVAKDHQLKGGQHDRMFSIPVHCATPENTEGQPVLRICSCYEDNERQLHFASVLIEYPGSGQSCGPPLIESILSASVQGISQAIVELCHRLRVSCIDIRIIGYSLGTAVALRIAHILSLDITSNKDGNHSVVRNGAFRSLKVPPRLILSRVILVAPLTSVTEWATNFFKVPHLFRPAAKLLITPLLNVAGVCWDNTIVVEKLSNIIHRYKTMFSTFKLCIIHGSKDKMIPSWMGKKLAMLSRRFLETSPTCNLKRPSSENTDIKETAQEIVLQHYIPDIAQIPTKQVEMSSGSDASGSRGTGAVHFFEVSADHNTVMKKSRVQNLIYTCMLSTQYVTNFKVET